jgi:protease-4
MATRTDDIIDRRRLRRKLTFWRVAALLVLAAALAGTAAWFYGDIEGATAGDHVARIRIEGTITEDDRLLELLDKVGKSASVKGVVLTVDSPGGTTAGGEAIYEAVRKLAGEKPVVAQVGTLAASAGYMIASAADHIVARQSSIVGSIGVLFQYPDVTGLMDKVGVKLEGVKSAPLKAEPSPFNPTTEEERTMIRNLVMDSYDWFVGLVETRRGLTHEQALALADGSIYTGRQGLKNKLVDEVGGVEAARAWLATKNVPAGLDLVEWKPRRDSAGWLFGQSSMRALAAWLGLPAAGSDILAGFGADRIFLDGLVSVWQPAEGR